MKFVEESGEQFEVQCAASDTILKVKHRLFIEKDMPVDQLVLNNMGKELTDDTLVSGLALVEGQALQVVLKKDELITSNDKYDVIRKNDECFMRFKDDDGVEIYRQFGKLGQNGTTQLIFKDQAVPSIKELLLKD